MSGSKEKEKEKEKEKGRTGRDVALDIVDKGW
jgi:hypothetical protein